MIAAHMAKKLFGHDEADATWRPTSAWIVLIILQIETIVECDFFLGQDVAGVTIQMRSDSGSASQFGAQLLRLTPDP